MAKFELSLIVGKEEYKSKANDVISALGKLKLTKIGTWGVFILKSGDKKTEIRMRPMQIRRLLASQTIAKEIFQKRMLASLK